MTDQDIYELLVSVDHGNNLTAMEYQQLSTVTNITWRLPHELPHNMGLLKRVTSLDLRGTDISDISAISEMTGLTNLFLGGTRVSDINVLSGLQSLISLDLRGTKVSDINALSGLQSLTTLDLSGTRVSDINALSGLQSLTTLDLSGTRVSDINALSRLSSLRTLSLGNENVNEGSTWQLLKTLTAHYFDKEVVIHSNNLFKILKITELLDDKTRKIDSSSLLRIRQLSSLFNDNVWNDDYNIHFSYINILRDKYQSLSNKLLDLMDPGLPTLAFYNMERSLLSNMFDSDNANVSDISALSKLTSLTFLDLRYSRVSDISPLSGLTALNSLDLSNTSVSDISNLSTLTALRSLNLSHTKVSDISALSNLTSLSSLDLSHTCVADISILSLLTSLMFLSIRGLDVNDIRPLNGLKLLRFLSMAHTCVSDISALSGIKSLMLLDLGHTRVNDISALSGIKSLMFLDLSHTRVNDINALSGLKSLKSLNISHLTLNVIPEFLLDLKLSFKKEEYWFIFGGIFINGLKLVEQPIEIFSEDSKLIRAYYRAQDKVPINECKVIFLGDAEAGKTHSIRRLIEKGVKLKDFDGNSTPGIEITVSSTTIEETDIVVNYWDFGGQEIQHSMHRMFLTERTVYVVFLNARQDPLDERARYWIENINSFASGAPILLVINKIDQNNRPKFNEDGIRAAYKDQIKGVVRMSALNDEPEVFLGELEGSINEIIKELPTASTLVPKAWKSLMEDLRSTSKHYLTTNEFKEKCEFYYVNNYDKIHNSLVNLFQDIGVSFCYYKDRSIADYMLLNPKWLVNALYTIVTNSKDITQNGIIKQEDLYDVLKEDNIKGMPIRRVVPEWRYEGIQVNYILGVIRMFRLSYQLKDGSEFFPMLCDGNEKISVSKAVSSNALHYVFKYTYLPANVLHRLIVEKQRDLDYNYVWYSGAVFRNEAQAQIAYVHTIGNSLHIYVDCYNSFYNPNEYLTPILNEVRGINQDIGLQAEELIGLQINGKQAEIQVDLLIGNLSNGIERTFISKEIGVVDIRQILFRYNDYRPTGDEKLFNTIIASLTEMQNEKNFYKTDENSRNRFVSQQLRSAGYYCGDQVPGGLSATGKSIGARDGVIKDNNNHDISIFEGLNLDSMVKGTINLHLDKLLVNYNPQGLPNGFMLVYLDCARDSYKGFIARYVDYIKDYAPESYTCISAPSIIRTPSNGQFLNCIKMDYECGGYYYTIYHIVVRIAES